MRGRRGDGEGIAQQTEHALDSQMRGFEALVQARIGLVLSDAGRILLRTALLRRMAALGSRSLFDYYRCVSSDPQEEATLFEALCTHETAFFRDPQQFAVLEREVYPRLPRGRVRALSAGCSTGEEAFSIAMSLARHLGIGADFEVVGVDVSEAALSHARGATWSLSETARIPIEDMRSFMLEGTGEAEGLVRVCPEIRRLVRFARVNLVDADDPLQGRFDLITCRNVLMYFSRATKEQVIARLMAHLSPRGCFVLGYAESLPASAGPFEALGANVHLRAPPGGGAGGARPR